MLRAIGICLHRRGKYARALRHAKDAMHIFQVIDGHT